MRIKTKIKIVFTILCGICIFSLTARIYDNTVSKSVSEISRHYAVTEINKSINGAITDCMEKYDLKSSDFLVYNDKGRNMSANSVLINKICAESADEISKRLNVIDIPAAELNLSMLSNFFAVFNIKFNYSIDVTAVGSTEADYETEFVSSGINRTNFRVWLNVKNQVAIVDLFHTEKLDLNRKIMIIDSVIEGDVPSTYLQMKSD